MLSNFPNSPNFPRMELLRDNASVSTSIDLIAAGWVFAAEPTTDARWRVLAIKNDDRLAATALHLGDAFQLVELEARLRETESVALPS